MKRLLVVVLPLLIAPLVALSVLAWSLAGRAEDKLLATQRRQHADLATTFELRLDDALERLAGAFREWGQELASGSLASLPPERGQSWTLVLDDQGRWWHPAVYAAHFFTARDSESMAGASAEQLAQAARREHSARSPALTAEEYEALDQDSVPPVIRAQALLGLARCARGMGDPARSGEIYRRLMQEFNEVVDETGMNFGAEAGAAFIAMGMSEEGEPTGVDGWRELADGLLAGRYPMPSAFALGHLSNALSAAPPAAQEADDARRREQLERAVEVLREMTDAAAAVGVRGQTDAPVLQTFGRRVLLVQPVTLSQAAGWVVAGFRLDWVRADLLGPVIAELNARGGGAAFVQDAHGQAVVGPGLDAEAVSKEVSLSRWGLGWTMGVGFADLAEIRAQATRRNMLLMGSIVLLVVLGVAGVVIGGRMVRREIELSRLKTEFVDNVSHELRTPVTSIKLFSELLHGDQVRDADRQREYHRLLASESDRLARMVENMLNFSRIVAGRMRLRREPTEMAEYLRGLHRQWEIQARPTGHHVRLHLGDELPVCAIDRDAVARAVANLVSNAIKYSPVEREIVVTAQRRDEMVSIMVRDNGVGVAACDLPHVFERFYRVRNPKGDHVQGTGLGLTIVKDTVDRHGGKVRIDSQPGEGTLVELMLPIKEGATQQ